MPVTSHPFADLFPMLGATDAETLRADILANGLRDRIVIHDGMILDGRNRYLALYGFDDRDLPPEGDDLWLTTFRRFVPAQDGDPLAWVLSKNLHRRHLNDSQRAMVAARLANLGNGQKASSSANLQSTPVTQPEAAEQLHVSVRSVSSARDVIDHGAPELVERVDRGEIAVSAAAEVAKLDPEEQRQLIETVSSQKIGAAAKERAAMPRDARAVMSSRVEPPDSLDFFPTPPWATRALTQIVLPHLSLSLAGQAVWEPACGEGHIAAVLGEANPLVVWATDIHDYSADGRSPPHWTGVADYLADDGTDPGADWVITNPPFDDKAERFVLRALDQAAVGVAVFVRMTWLETVGRYERLFRDHPPTLIAFFAERVNLCKGRWEPEGSTASAYIWIVWAKGREPQAPFWIPPGQREAMARPGDVERFTAHPVLPAPAEAHATSEIIAMSFEEARPILIAEYCGDNGQELAERLGRPIATIRTWAYRLGLTSKARDVARAQQNIRQFNAQRKGQDA